MPVEYTAENWRKILNDIESNFKYEEDRLDLGGKILDEQKIEELITALQINFNNYQKQKYLPCIRWIDFNDVQLNEKLIEKLAAKLSKITTNIAIINLTNNNFKNCSCLVDFLKQQNLIKLILACNQLDDANLAPFIAALSDKNCCLKTLDLANNKLGNSIKLILEQNISLKYVDLSNNQFADDTMQKLVKGLNVNKTVKKIGINACGIIDADIQQLFNEYSTVSLEKLYLCDNDGVTEESKVLLEMMVSKHQNLEIYIDEGQKISAQEKLSASPPRQNY